MLLFHVKSNCYGLEAQKGCFGPEIGHTMPYTMGQKMGKFRFRIMGHSDDYSILRWDKKFDVGSLEVRKCLYPIAVVQGTMGIKFSFQLLLFQSQTLLFQSIH